LGREDCLWGKGRGGAKKKKKRFFQYSMLPGVAESPEDKDFEAERSDPKKIF